MARIHVLDCIGVDLYVVVVHDATPTGNNSTGVPWSTAVINSGRAFTVLTEGTGPGQISTSEKASVENGTILEGVFHFQDNPSWNAATRAAMLDSVANACIAELQARYAKELKFYGATRG